MERPLLQYPLLHCRIVKLVRALRKGWIKRDRQVAPQEPATYLMWDDDLQTEDKTLAGGLPMSSEFASPMPNWLLLAFSLDLVMCMTSYDWHLQGMSHSEFSLFRSPPLQV